MARESHAIDLGLQAYASDEHSSADLLKNLEGRRVHRFAEGTGEHAGTALMAVELSDGLLGVQVSMEFDTSEIEVYPDVRRKSEGSWVCESFTELRQLSQIEEPCPDCEIVEVLQRNIMDPETAEVVCIMNPQGENPYGLNIYLDDETGGTEFFEL